MIPEFVGRLPVVGTVNQLETEALIEILTEPRNALIKQYQRIFGFDDVELKFTDEALTAVAEQALERGTGARGLRAILEEVLLGTMYELPSDNQIAEVVIEADCVIGQMDPTIIERNASNKRAAS